MNGERAFFCRPSSTTTKIPDTEFWPNVIMKITLNLDEYLTQPTASDSDDVHSGRCLSEIEGKVSEMLTMAMKQAQLTHIVTNENMKDGELPKFKMTITGSLDWIKQVEDSYKPILIRKSDAVSEEPNNACNDVGNCVDELLIVPSWKRDQMETCAKEAQTENDTNVFKDNINSNPESQVTLLLEPGLAFGTGKKDMYEESLCK